MVFNAFKHFRQSGTNILDLYLMKHNILCLFLKLCPIGPILYTQELRIFLKAR